MDVEKRTGESELLAHVVLMTALAVRERDRQEEVVMKRGQRGL